MTHICVSKLNSIGSDNGLSPGQRQAIIWTNTEVLLIRPLGTNFSEIFTKIYTFSFKKVHCKMLSGKWQPFCLGLNVLRIHSPSCLPTQSYEATPYMTHSSSSIVLYNAASGHIHCAATKNIHYLTWLAMVRIIVGSLKFLYFPRNMLKLFCILLYFSISPFYPNLQGSISRMIFQHKSISMDISV